MALGDLMASRFSHSSAAVVSGHVIAAAEECISVPGGVSDELDGRSGGGSGGDLRRDSEAASSSYDNAGSGAGAGAATSMAYLPQTVVLCECRHDAFEACLPAGPSDSGLVSKWRPKDRVITHFSLSVFILSICCYVLEEF